jgi:ribosomal protein L40E
MYSEQKQKSTLLVNYIKSVALEPIFYQLIAKDKQISDHHLANGECRKCHSKNLRYHSYVRKVRWGPFEFCISVEILEQFTYRHSSKCRDCGAQNTPASVRFLGRKVHAGLLVLIVILFLEELPADARILQYLLGPDLMLRTALRWLHWLNDTVVQSPIWKIVQGAIGVVGSVKGLVAQFRPQFESTEGSFPAILNGISPITIPQHYRAIGDIPLRILRAFFSLFKSNTKMDVANVTIV